MKITQKQAIDAYKAVRKLEYQDMPGEKAMAMFRLRKALEPQYQFQDEQERKELESLGADISQTGDINFKDDESKQKYIEKIKEIEELEVDVDIAKETLDIHGMMISAKDIEALDPIVKIVC